LVDHEHLLEKARMLLQRERELFDLRSKFDQLALWLSVGQALPDLFVERGRPLPQILDRLRKLLIAKLRLQRVLVFEVAADQLRPISPAGEPRALSAEVSAFLDAQASGVCNEAAVAPALATLVGLHRFMWSRLTRARGAPILLVAGFDATKAAFQASFGDNDVGHFVNAMRQVEALLANHLLVDELEAEKAHLEQANLKLEQRDRELSKATEQLLAVNETLEQRVRERTTALASKNAELRLIFDNVDQGLIIVDLEGRMARERSRVVDAWFGAVPDAARLSDYLSADRRFAELLNWGLDALREDVMPRALCLEQLPHALRVGGRHFRCRYLPVDAEGKAPSLLLVIDDVTEQLELAREEAQQRELLAAFTALMRDRTGFLRFFEEGERMLDELRGAATADARRKQLLHTLKGNAGTLGLHVVAELCHAAESQLENRDSLVPDSIEPLRARWAAVSGSLHTLAPTSLKKTFELSEPELARLSQRARSGASGPQIVEELERLCWEPVSRVLDRLGQQARGLALRLGRGAIDVQIEADDFRLAPEVWEPLWSALVHVIRNAVDHGLEPASDRVAAGKPARGRLRLSAQRLAEGYRLELSDDGRGVDWASVRSLCLSRGRRAESRQDLLEALLSHGFSTKREITETSGRGVGLAALAVVVRERSGLIELESEAGQGTSWVLTFPRAL